METENNATNEQQIPETTEEMTNVENQNSESSETGGSETSGQSTDPSNSDVEVLFVDPAPQTTYSKDGYEIDIIHSVTLGDILTSTLIVVLIIVVFLSRVLGRGRY